MNHTFPKESPGLNYMLAKIYRFPEGVMSLRRFLEGRDLTRKSADIQEYSSRRINLEYKKLKKPVTSYTLWWIEDGKEIGIQVPKLVYDHVVIGEANEIQRTDD